MGGADIYENMPSVAKVTQSKKKIASIWIWFDGENDRLMHHIEDNDDDIPPLNCWRFDIERPEAIYTFGEEIIPEVGAMGLGVEYATAGAALDAAMKWCKDRGLELNEMDFHFGVLK